MSGRRRIQQFENLGEKKERGRLPGAKQKGSWLLGKNEGCGPLESHVVKLLAGSAPSMRKEGGGRPLSSAEEQNSPTEEWREPLLIVARIKPRCQVWVPWKKRGETTVLGKAKEGSTHKSI